MSGILIKGGSIINEGQIFEEDLAILDSYIVDPSRVKNPERVLDATGLWVMPGIIDDQVHFRQPGLEMKGTIATESMAALAGGITSFMEMPNTLPPATTLELVKQKEDIAKRDSWCNYSFYLGATNNNLKEIRSIDPRTVCGVKVFMGSSTGDLLVDDEDALFNLFSESKVPVAVHSEDEETIRRNLSFYREKFGNAADPAIHPIVRSEEACVLCTARAIEYCRRTGGHLHLLHISTGREVDMIREAKLEGLNISAEVCVHHLWFSKEDYAVKGNLIKWNPSIKETSDRQELLEGLLDKTLDIVATDHAPHELEKKMLNYFDAPSGGPLVQYSLLMMLELARERKCHVTDVMNWMAHKPASLFKIDRRGYLRKGFYADVILVDPNAQWKVLGDQTFSKVKWSPLDGTVLHHKVITSIVNGKILYEKGSFIKDNRLPMALQFLR